ncbi:hypothetical protein HYFRA_00013383 [Hymenoscyphus fraxineus]|uniref:Uncharacterized protein n=1 Tax=Hymenoscyphus fraxineus TaxID=746836 RepID=A0A9N9PYN7_9HELO|nr:hypothetical protein HYFRA_00013383 [Hymenoscyphus fraxineus]
MPWIFCKLGLGKLHSTPYAPITFEDDHCNPQPAISTSSRVLSTTLTPDKNDRGSSKSQIPVAQKVSKLPKYPSMRNRRVFKHIPTNPSRKGPSSFFNTNAIPPWMKKYDPYSKPWSGSELSNKKTFAIRYCDLQNKSKPNGSPKQQHHERPPGLSNTSTNEVDYGISKICSILNFIDDPQTQNYELIVEPQHQELPAGFSTSTNKVDCHVSKRLFALDGDPFLAPKKRRMR